HLAGRQRPLGGGAPGLRQAPPGRLRAGAAGPRQSRRRRRRPAARKGPGSRRRRAPDRGGAVLGSASHPVTRFFRSSPRKRGPSPVQLGDGASGHAIGRRPRTASTPKVLGSRFRGNERREGGVLVPPTAAPSARRGFRSAGP